VYLAFAGCGDAPEVVNGQHKADYSREIGASVAYICQAGYKLVGKETVVCEASTDGKTAAWTVPPKCVIGNGRDLSIRTLRIKTVKE